MITTKDRQLLRHIDQFGFITIEQAHKMLYPNMKRGYEYARQRLQILTETEERLNFFTDTATKIKIFIDKESSLKSISQHRMYTMNLYCNLMGSKDIEVEEFTLEKQWNKGKVRSDAFCICLVKSGTHTYKFRLLIETNTSNHNLNLIKYDDEKVYREILLSCNNEVPRIVLIDDRKHKCFDTKKYQVVTLDYNMTNIHNLLI